MELSFGIILKMLVALVLSYLVGRFPYSKPKGITKSILHGFLRLAIVGLACEILPVWLFVLLVIVGVINVIVKMKKENS